MSIPHYFDNPIKILHHLQEAGFTQKQAEAQVEIFASFATKRDLKEFGIEIKEFEIEIDAKLKEFGYSLTVKIAAIVASVVGFFYLLEKFI